MAQPVLTPQPVLRNSLAGVFGILLLLCIYVLLFHDTSNTTAIVTVVGLVIGSLFMTLFWEHHFKNLRQKLFPSDDQIIIKYIERKKIHDNKKEEEKNRQEKAAHKLWELKNSDDEEQNWKVAEELLEPLYWKLFRRVDLVRRYFKSFFKKTNKYITISIGISMISLFALLLHLGYVQLEADKQIKFDSTALILLILVLIPCFSIFLEKATLPGGWNLEFRKIKEQQNIQKEEINDIKFLLSHYVTVHEKDHLQYLNSPNPFGRYEFKGNFEEELKRLLALKLIERHPGKGIRSAKGDNREDRDLKDHFYITHEGKEYLARLERSEKDEE